jgi:hypothetical protein
MSHLSQDQTRLERMRAYLERRILEEENVSHREFLIQFYTQTMHQLQLVDKKPAPVRQDDGSTALAN